MDKLDRTGGILYTGLNMGMKKIKNPALFDSAGKIDEPCPAADYLNLVIQKWKAGRRRGIIGIDGMCGSGKTTLASRLEKILGFPVFHMDDYYLPFSRREEGWQNICAGNMDLRRLEREVLIPLSCGQAVNTARYNCREDKMTQDRRGSASFAILEGTYSLHPQIRAYLDLTFFLFVSDRIQKNRLEAREGANYQNFLNVWIPMENHYFQEVDPKQGSDFRIELDAEGKVIYCEEKNKYGVIA